ncbi:hypothetical protein MBRA_18750 [Mycobacterium branderi]|uniref:Uncharacterized protein n=1 Tax=Mycobacterium branderi TaxID=43348 RepID=A0ABN6B349_9MYCO|nr:hypothetical protein MBRA_18750 [Mycobacterium branderi]
MLVNVHMVSPSMTMPAPPPIGTLSSAAAVRGPATANSEAITNAAATRNSRQCVVCKELLPSTIPPMGPGWVSLT